MPEIIQDQINELNKKLDFVIEEIHAQKNARIEKEDLFADLSIIGNDAFSHTVTSLDKAGVELDGEALSALLIKLVRNIGTFNNMMDTLESVNDLMKDVSPIINQVGLDAIAKFAEFEQKGYLNLLLGLVKSADKIGSHITIQDIRILTENAETFIITAKSMSDEKIPKYSMMKTIRELNSPEMKKTMGFMLTFMKKLSANFSNK